MDVQHDDDEGWIVQDKRKKRNKQKQQPQPQQQQQQQQQKQHRQHLHNNAVKIETLKGSSLGTKSPYKSSVKKKSITVNKHELIPRAEVEAASSSSLSSPASSKPPASEAAVVPSSSPWIQRQQQIPNTSVQQSPTPSITTVTTTPWPSIAKSDTIATSTNAAFQDKNTFGASPKFLPQRTAVTINAKIESPAASVKTENNDDANVHIQTNHIDQVIPAGVHPAEPKEEVSSNSSEVITESSSAASQIKLKYFYNEDQWSPLKHDGKKQYDHQFLLQLQNAPLSLMKPTNLPDSLEIIKNEPVLAAGGRQDWTSDYVVSSHSQKGSMSRKASRDARRQTNSQSHKIIDVNIQQQVELHQSENAWKAVTVKPQNGSSEEDPVEELAKKVRGIINKLCPQKFDILAEQFKKLPIDNEEKLLKCIHLVFEKAVDEQGFSEPYARLCEVMQGIRVNGQGLNFRQLLLSRCKQEFERDYLVGLNKAKYLSDLAESTDDDRKKEVQADWEEKELKARRRSLGNVRFIGELYKLKMLNASTINSCVQQLLNHHQEESLECLCRLLTTVGKDLEAETNSSSHKNSSMPLNEYFNQIKKIIDMKEMSSRVRFMLQDLIDLRMNNWKPRRDVSGPKTLSEIYKEVQKEKLSMELTKQDLNQPKRSSNASLGRINSTTAEDDFITIRTFRASRNLSEFDLAKVSNIAQSRGLDADTMEFGPNTRHAWGKGSGGGKNLSTQTKNDFTTTPLKRNRFELLNNEGTLPVRSGPSLSIGAPGQGSSGNLRGDSERQRAMQAVRDISNAAASSSNKEVLLGGPAVSTSSQPRGGHGHPVPETLKDVPDVMEQASQLKGKPDMSDSEARKKSSRILEDLLCLHDREDAVLSICELMHPSSMVTFVDTWITVMLDKRSRAQDSHLVGSLLDTLVSRHILLKMQLFRALDNVAQNSDDMIFDVPKLWEYLAEIVTPLIESGTLDLGFLCDLNWPMIKDNGANVAAAKFLVAVLKNLQSRIGKELVSHLWNSVEMKLDGFFKHGELDDFVNNSEILGFSLSKENGHDETWVFNHLLPVFKSNVDPDQVNQWIKV